MTIRAVILWVHVVCGVVWVGACATFLLAAIAAEPNDAFVYAVRIVPQINRLSMALAIAIPATGIGNLFFAMLARGSPLPTEFIGILVAKIGLLTVMLLALIAGCRATQKLEQKPLAGGRDDGNVRSIVACYGLIVGAGIAALGLGLWLSGT
jgi:putative copper export protein